LFHDYHVTVVVVAATIMNGSAKGYDYLL